MTVHLRKLLDRASTGINIFSIIFMIIALLILLTPIIVRGIRAYIFMGTIEHREVIFEEFKRGNKQELEKEKTEVQKARAPVYELLSEFETQMAKMKYEEKQKYKEQFEAIKDAVEELLGPFPGSGEKLLLRNKYGSTRWDKAKENLNDILYYTEWDYSDPNNTKQVTKKRKKVFKGTSLEKLFIIFENKKSVKKMLKPKLTFYFRFLLDKSKDSHFFGGIYPEVLGTFYLTFFAMVFAIPFGIIAAIYLAEFSKEGKIVSLLRTFINTLAGVPSIVFGLFGLAFFINTIHVSNSKSVLAGSLTLSLLILPTIIRASEEAILAVPKSYKEASLAVGASHLKTVMTVMLPAALPGILTGIIISMGRAAGETAPIIFTAAVSVGKPLKFWGTMNQPTPALPWNIYNISTEHEAVDEIRHVQFGMVFTLVVLVLLLNLIAIITRAKITKKLRG